MRLQGKTFVWTNYFLFFVLFLHMPPLTKPEKKKIEKKRKLIFTPLSLSLIILEDIVFRWIHCYVNLKHVLPWIWWFLFRLNFLSQTIIALQILMQNYETWKFDISPEKNQFQTYFYSKLNWILFSLSLEVLFEFDEKIMKIKKIIITSKM